MEVYGGPVLTTVTDVASGRALHLTWTGGQVASVATDPPAVGQAAPTWTYTYTGAKLTGVCTALGASSCTGYTYTSSSHYRSIVLDDSPIGYWPLGESSGTTASNVAARSVGQFDATYSGVTLGVAGALAGSPDTAATFASGASSRVSLPTDLISKSMNVAVELWFKASSGSSGVLLSEQSVAPPAVPTTSWAPNLYVDTAGKLRGYFWTPATAGVGQMVTAGTVTNGQWHHVVLSASVSRQELYLDGVLVGSLTGQTISHTHELRMGYLTVGNGYANGWPSATSGYMPFTGQIDDVAVYQHPLGQTQVAAHYAGRTATSRLSTVVEPGSFTAASVDLSACHRPGVHARRPARRDLDAVGADVDVDAAAGDRVVERDDASHVRLRSGQQRPVGVTHGHVRHPHHGLQR